MSKQKSSSYPADQEILYGILNNEGIILERLYKAYFPMVLQLIINNNGTDDDAKDVYQEAIIVLYEKVKAGNFELNSKLKTFLYSVCRRLWLKKLNYQSRFVGNLNDYEDHFVVDHDIAVHEEKEMQLNKMAGTLDELGEPCKTIIEDFYIHHMGMQEICEKFGYTNADNAKTQKYKCLQRLKKLFFLKNN